MNGDPCKPDLSSGYNCMTSKMKQKSETKNPVLRYDMIQGMKDKASNQEDLPKVGASGSE